MGQLFQSYPICLQRSFAVRTLKGQFQLTIWVKWGVLEFTKYGGNRWTRNDFYWWLKRICADGRNIRQQSCASRNGYQLEINRKKKLFRRGTPPASHPPVPRHHVASRDAPRLPWFKHVTSPSHEASSTTTPHTYMRPYAVLLLLILYYTECKSVFWGTKRIQIKNLSITEFHNFLRSTTFMLGVFPFEIIYEIWISNLRDSNLDFIDNMISNKKFVNYEIS
jgi:hypothetical protein